MCHGYGYNNTVITKRSNLRNAPMARNFDHAWYKCAALHGVLWVSAQRMKREAGEPHAMADMSSLRSIPALPPQR
jgi:hypothetical protein